MRGWDGEMQARAEKMRQRNSPAAIEQRIAQVRRLRQLAQRQHRNGVERTRAIEAATRALVRAPNSGPACQCLECRLCAKRMHQRIHRLRQRGYDVKALLAAAS